MEDLFFSLLTLVLQRFRPRYNAHLQLLQAQIRILRSRIDVSRIVPTPKEKAELLRLGAQIDHDIAEVMHVVQPDTYRKWVRQSKRGVVFKRPGRPRIPMAIVNRVLRMAQENARWSYRRIVGEFKKLGIRIGGSTVKKILNESDIHPAPDKGFKKPAIPWTTLVHAHMDSTVGADLFTKRTACAYDVRIMPSMQRHPCTEACGKRFTFWSTSHPKPGSTPSSPARCIHRAAARTTRRPVPWARVPSGVFEPTSRNERERLC